MDGTGFDQPCPPFGQITIQEPEAVSRPGLAGDGTVISFTRRRHIWQPVEAIRDQLPGDFTLALECCIDTGGTRRFVLCTGVDEFIGKAFTGGLTILSKAKNLTAHQRYSYRASYLLFDRARQTQGHLRRRFRYLADLTIRVSGRDSPDERHVLPFSLGITPDGSPTELIRRGNEAAESAGVREPSIEQCIHFGLWQAAKEDPLDLPPDQVPRLVRHALYEMTEPRQRLDDTALDQVTERILEGLYKHLRDGSAAFTQWFSGGHNSLVARLTKSMRAGGLDRDQIKQALAELGWRAYRYVGDCVHAQMLDFLNAMPAPLSGEEKALFEHMHLRQPYYGGFPLVLLAERMSFVKQAVLDIWDSPKETYPVQVLHRLLQYYACMTMNRRDADRRAKRRRLEPLWT